MEQGAGPAADPGRVSSEECGPNATRGLAELARLDGVNAGGFRQRNGFCLWLTVLVVRGHTCASQFGRTADLARARGCLVVSWPLRSRWRLRCWTTCARARSHVVFEVVSLFPGRFVPVGACDVGPHVREHGVLKDSVPIGVHVPEVELRGGITLFRSQVEPPHGFGSVLEDALAVGVHDPEVELRIGVALFGGQPVPAHGFGSVLEAAHAGGVHVPEVELRGGITLFRSGQRPVKAPDAPLRSHRGCGGQPWYFIDRLPMWALSSLQTACRIDVSPCFRRFYTI